MTPGEKRVLVIDSCQATREARVALLREHGVEVYTAANLEAARWLWEPEYYDLVLLDVRRYLPGEALEFCKGIKEKSPEQRIAFLVGPPRYLSLEWPEDVSTMDPAPPQGAATVKRLAAA